MSCESRFIPPAWSRSTLMPTILCRLCEARESLQDRAMRPAEHKGKSGGAGSGRGAAGRLQGCRVTLLVAPPSELDSGPASRVSVSPENQLESYQSPPAITSVNGLFLQVSRVTCCEGHYHARDTPEVTWSRRTTGTFSGSMIHLVVSCRPAAQSSLLLRVTGGALKRAGIVFAWDLLRCQIPAVDHERSRRVCSFTQATWRRHFRLQGTH